MYVVCVCVLGVSAGPLTSVQVTIHVITTSSQARNFPKFVVYHKLNQDSCHSMGIARGHVDQEPAWCICRAYQVGVPSLNEKQKQAASSFLDGKMCLSVYLRICNSVCFQSLLSVLGYVNSSQSSYAEERHTALVVIGRH